VSTTPPAPKGTMSLMGCDGYVACARAEDAAAKATTHAAKTPSLRCRALIERLSP
jgi:hypothetical protein